MFRDSRDPCGRYTGVVAGIACLLLASFLAPVGGWAALGSLLLAVAGAALILRWWLRRRSERYDLKRLWEREPEPEEPLEDTLPDDESAAPYCGWCDEANPAGTRRCVRCGRSLG